MYLSMRLIQMLAAELQRRGIEASQVLEPAGISLSDGEGRVAVEQLDQFVHCALQFSDDPPMRLPLATGAPGYALQLLGYLVISSVPLQGALASFLDHDTNAERIVREAATKLLRLSTPPEELADRVRMLLRSGAFVQDDVSKLPRRLGMSKRALRGRLSKEGVSLSVLIDEVRCHAACAALRRPNASIREISDRLGFSEPSAFHRAFKRWTGKTPRKFLLEARLRPAEPSLGSETNLTQPAGTTHHRAAEAWAGTTRLVRAPLSGHR